MPRFHAQKFLNRTTGEVKTFSYTIPVPKAIVEAVNLEDKEVIIGIKEGKIIIEEKNIDKQKF